MNNETVNYEQRVPKPSTKRAWTPTEPGDVCERAAVRDFVYSEERGMFGVIMAIDVTAGTMEIHIGHETLRYYENGNYMVRPNWDAATRRCAWERLKLLVDE